MSEKNTLSATFLGYIALAMWAGSGVLASSVIRIPTFEILSVAFSISFGITAVILTIKKQWHRVKQPLVLWLIGMVGVYGNDALFISAFKYAPAAQADLINYLYPILIILFASFLPNEKFQIKYIIAALLGFIGTFLIVTNGHGFSGFHPKYLHGYILAFLDAIVWSVYSIIARHYRNTPSEMVGMYCGCGLIFSLIAHFSFEPNVTPHIKDLLVMVTMGLTTQGGAYFLWDYGVKKGNFRLLGILSYTNPVIAIFLLILAGKSQYSDILILSACLIAAGGAIASVNIKTLLKTLHFCVKKLNNPIPKHD